MLSTYCFVLLFQFTGAAQRFTNNTIPINQEQYSSRASMNTSIPDYDSQGAHPKQENTKTKERRKKSSPGSQRVRWEKDEHSVDEESCSIRDHGSDEKEYNARKKKYSSVQKDHSLNKEHTSDQREHRLDSGINTYSCRHHLNCSVPEGEPVAIGLDSKYKSSLQQMNSEEAAVTTTLIQENASLGCTQEEKDIPCEHQLEESTHTADSLNNQLSEMVNDSGGYRIADMIRSLPDLSMMEGRCDSRYGVNIYNFNISNTNNTMNTVNGISEPRTPTELTETERFPEVLLEALKRLDLEDWKMLASHLGLDRFIDGIEAEAKNHHKSPTQLLLNKWYQNQGNTQDKISTIKAALEKMGRRDVLDALEDKEEEWDHKVTVEDCEE